jgi:hypothetical protein
MPDYRHAHRLASFMVFIVRVVPIYRAHVCPGVGATLCVLILCLWQTHLTRSWEGARSCVWQDWLGISPGCDDRDDLLKTVVTCPPNKLLWQ